MTSASTSSSTQPRLTSGFCSLFHQPEPCCSLPTYLRAPSLCHSFPTPPHLSFWGHSSSISKREQSIRGVALVQARQLRVMDAFDGRGHVLFSRESVPTPPPALNHDSTSILVTVLLTASCSSREPTIWRCDGVVSHPPSPPLFLVQQPRADSTLGWSPTLGTTPPAES